MIAGSSDEEHEPVKLEMVTPLPKLTQKVVSGFNDKLNELPFLESC